MNEGTDTNSILYRKFNLELRQGRGLFWAFTVFIITVFLLAYLGMIPRDIKAIPYYDSIGHFVLYGLWALFLDQMLGKKNLLIGKMGLPLAIVIMVGVASAEELLQMTSGLRTVSLADWGWGIAGIMLIVAFRRFVFNGIQRP